MYVSRKNRSRSPDRGRWQLERERFQIDDEAPDPPFREARPFGDVVRAVMAAADRVTPSLRFEIEAAWTATVGAQVAKHTRPGALRGRELTVHVDGVVWLHELRRTAVPRMCKALRERWGADRIATVRLVLEPDAPAAGGKR